MNILWYVNSILVSCGIIILVFSFFCATRIIAELEGGSIKGRWVLLRILIIIFIVGYTGFLAFMPHQAESHTLIVSVMFFSGGIFVLIACLLMLQTIRDVKQVSVLKLENVTDPLMNIYNRRYLEQRLKEEVIRTKRYKTPLSLLMIDIDYFKQINDQHGHLAGDNILSTMGHILKEQIRKSDLVARYGGEEIVLMLPNTKEKDATSLAERLRYFIETHNFSATKDCDLHCTVSIGIASIQEDENYEATELLHRADVGLYHAKQTGRNKVSSYTDKNEQG